MTMIEQAKQMLQDVLNLKAKYYKRTGSPGNYKYYYTKQQYDKAKKQQSDSKKDSNSSNKKDSSDNNNEGSKKDSSDNKQSQSTVTDDQIEEMMQNEHGEDWKDHLSEDDIKEAKEEAREYLEEVNQKTKKNDNN